MPNSCCFKESWNVFQVGPIYSVKWMPLLWPLLVEEVACPSSYLSCLEDCCPHSKQNQEIDPTQIPWRSGQNHKRREMVVSEYLDYSNYGTSMRVFLCFPAYGKITKDSLWQTTVAVVTTKQTNPAFLPTSVKKTYTGIGWHRQEFRTRRLSRTIWKLHFASRMW